MRLIVSLTGGMISVQTIRRIVSILKLSPKNVSVWAQRSRKMIEFLVTGYCSAAGVVVWS